VTADTFVDPSVLVDGGPRRFTRQVERLLAQAGFTDVVNVDGSGDKGRDILAVRDRRLWVVQCKWQARGVLPRAGVDEVAEAYDHYRANQAVVVTNVRPGPSAVRRAQDLARVGHGVAFWDGRDLTDLWLATDDPPQVRLRDYQRLAADRVCDALQRRGRALLVLATGLGKTVVGGEVIARHVADRPGLDVLVVAHTKELVNQLERALWRHLPKTVKTQVLTGDEKPRDLGGVTCATTLSALGAVQRGYRPGLVMVDETHHVAEEGGYDTLLGELDGARQFGVTATPWRGDSYDIEHRFGPAVLKVGIEDGMRLGYLARVDYRLFVDDLDWHAVRDASRHGYSIKELNAKLFLPQRDEAVRDELETVWSATPEPRGIVFCRTIEHAEHMAALLRPAAPGGTPGPSTPGSPCANDNSGSSTSGPAGSRC